MAWISIRNWRSFQHYDPSKRVPPWIKNHVELMANDEYLALTEHRALMLHRLWLEYATSRCQLSDDTLMLSRRLGMKVTRADLEALNQAGWIDLVASKALADGYHSASATLASRAPAHSRETETEEEPREGTDVQGRRAEAANNGTLAGLSITNQAGAETLLAWIGTHADDGTPQVVHALAAKLTEAQLATVLESTRKARPKDRAGYAVQALKQQATEATEARIDAELAKPRPDTTALVTGFVRSAARAHTWDDLQPSLAKLLEPVPAPDRPALLEAARATYDQSQPKEETHA